VEQRPGRGGSRPNTGRARISRPGDKRYVPQAFITRYHDLTNQQKHHHMGTMDVECIHCHALFWQEEYNVMNCCKKGEIVLPPVREPPDLLKRLLTRDHPNSDSFIKHIRQYNSALAFTSIAYTPDRRLRANEYNPTFQIQGELHHLQGPLNLQAGREPIYAQYFIYDPDKASRRRSTRNTELSQSLLRELDVMIRQFNPHYRIFKTAREVLNETSNSQSTRIIITPRLQLIMEKRYRGRYQRANSDTIGRRNARVRCS
jgi:hypothetical protein